MSILAACMPSGRSPTLDTARGSSARADARRWCFGCTRSRRAGRRPPASTSRFSACRASATSMLWGKTGLPRRVGTFLRSDGSHWAVSADAELPCLGPAGEGARVTPEQHWCAGTRNGAGAVATAERAGESSLPAATQRAVRLRSTSLRAACCCGGHYRGTAGAHP